MADEQETPPSWRDELRAFTAAPDAPATDAGTDEADAGTEGEGEHEHGASVGDRLGGLKRRAARVGGALIPKQAVQRVAALPTPGGLGLIVLALVFFVFVIVPVNANGETRFALIWRALTGGATVPPGPRKLRAQAIQAAQQQPASANPVQALLGDAENALGTFWIDHYVG